ncbi:hypothetical protein RB593_000078 [Gaeumannomyces tritici]
MFCLRSWLPLLFIPTNASPAFIFLFFVCTYFLNRPCGYCSFLLLILFMTSCNWSDRCFFDFSTNWFQSRPSSALVAPPPEAANASSALSACRDDLCAAGAVAAELLNTTAVSLAGAAADHAAKARAEWTGLGMEWLRSLLGRREWRIDCLDVNIRL